MTDAERPLAGEAEFSARISRLARLGRSRSFSPERFERELEAVRGGTDRSEILRLLLLEWTGVAVGTEEAVRLWRRLHRVLGTLRRALGSPVSLQTALLHELHTRLGLLQEPRLLSDRDISALRVNAITDPLTGLYNRRFLLDHLDREVSRAERAGGVVSLVMMDLAGFKGINDRLGHPVGDSILVRTARVIRDSLRAVDAGCRWGGDEFVAVLPNSDIVNSLAVAERIRQRAARIRLPLRVGLKIGMNYGVASFPTDGRVIDFLLKVSDIRLYGSKKQNGNGFSHHRRFPRFAVPGLVFRMGRASSRRAEATEVRDISYGGIAFLSPSGRPPARLQGEILQRFSSETHRVSMRPVSSLPLPDGRWRVGCAYDSH